MKNVLRFLCSLLFTILCAHVYAEDRFAYDAKDPSLVDIYIVTVGAADPIYMRGGHLVLRVVDRSRGVDDGYNWGIFDFDDPNFALRFFKGNLDYTVSASNFNDLLRWYSKSEHRSVWQHQLNLTNKQKMTILSRIDWWMKPANAYYKYDIREKNCTTIVRDMIAQALGPKFRTAFESVKVNDNFRNFFREAVSPWPPIYVTLDVLTNGSADHNETAWERMYSPLAIASLLADAPAYDDSGDPLANTKLLGQQQDLYREPASSDPDDTNGYIPYAVIVFLLSVPLFAHALRPSRTTLRLASISIGLVIMAFGLSAFLYGTIMIAGWTFSDRLEMQSNANLFVFWPTDIVYCLVGFHLLRMKKLMLKQRLKMLWQWTLGAHLVGIAVITLATVFGVWIQNCAGVLAFTAPLIVLSYLGQRHLDRNFTSPVVSKPKERKKTKQRRHAA